MLAGRLLHATGPATENARDPSFVRVLGRFKVVLRQICGARPPGPTAVISANISRLNESSRK